MSCSTAFDTTGLIATPDQIKIFLSHIRNCPFSQLTMNEKKILNSLSYIKYLLEEEKFI